MSQSVQTQDSLRDQIISEPEVILRDPDVMRALIAANERQQGDNIVDLRGIAMDRLESRLDRLEDTHRSVIAAAYENLAGTNQIHRAVLRMLDPLTFEDFVQNLGSEVAEVLRVDTVRLALETLQDGENPAVKKLGAILCTCAPGDVENYTRVGRAETQRQVTLRQLQPESDCYYGEKAEFVRSEAVIRLDLGPGRLPGMLLLGSEDPHHFLPSHGTDLLAFFGGVFERAMRRWLS